MGKDDKLFMLLQIYVQSNLELTKEEKADNELKDFFKGEIMKIGNELYNGIVPKTIPIVKTRDSLL